MARRALIALAAVSLALGLSVELWRGLLALPDPTPLRDPAWVSQRFKLSEWTHLDQVQPLALRCILLSEDDTFYEHDGLRLDELRSAAWDDLLSLRYKRGASSITQQVVRNAFLSKQKSLWRKLNEMVLARRADKAVGKARLLEDYINLAEWGSHGERGIAAAAREHFGKAPAQLSVAQGALLAWLLPQPRQRGRALRRGQVPAQALRHLRRLIRRLEREGSLSPEESERLQKHPFDPGSPVQPMTGGLGPGLEQDGGRP